MSCWVWELALILVLAGKGSRLGMWGMAEPWKHSSGTKLPQTEHSRRRNPGLLKIKEWFLCSAKEKSAGLFFMVVWVTVVGAQKDKAQGRFGYQIIITGK